MAEQSFKEGRALFQQRRYAEAADDFARANAADPKDKYLWNEALSEFRAGRHWAAFRHFQAYRATPTASPENLATADQILTRLRDRVGHLSIDAPPGSSVSVDGTAVGFAPLGTPIDVDPAQDHVVTATLANTQSTMHVPATGEGSTSVHLTIEAAQAEAPRPPSTSIPAPPAATAPIKAPSMTMRYVASGALAALAVTSAAIGVGYYAAYRNDVNLQGTYRSQLANEAANRKDNPSQVCTDYPALPECGAINGIIKQRNANVTIQNTAYGVAGGLGVAAVVVFLVWPRGSVQSAWLLPEIRRDGSSISFGGAF